MTSRFERAGVFVLFLAGLAMVGLAVIVDNDQAVATSLVGFGAGMMSLAVLLPRLEGRIKVGVQGLEAQLIAVVQEQAEAQGLSPEATVRAIEAARDDSDAWAVWIAELVARADSVQPGSRAAGRRDPLVRLAQIYIDRVGRPGGDTERNRVGRQA